MPTPCSIPFDLRVFTLAGDAEGVPHGVQRPRWGPLCAGLLRPIAVVKTAAEIHAVLAPLGFTRSHDLPFAHGPPVPDVPVLVAADSGVAYQANPPPFKSRLPYPRHRNEQIRNRLEMMMLGEDFDHSGYELPPAPAASAEVTGQGLLFDDDCSQPDLADGEPVFWTDGAEQAGPADDFVQADALESAQRLAVDSEQPEVCLLHRDRHDRRPNIRQAAVKIERVVEFPQRKLH